MAKVIGILNRKGGSGKTHASLNITASMALKKRKVLLIDADSQYNLTLYVLRDNEQYFEKYGGELKNEALSIRDCLYDKQKTKNAIIHLSYTSKRLIQNHFKKLECAFDYLPGNEYLAEFEHSDNPYFVKEMLDEVRDDYDYIIIDCPPNRSNYIGYLMIACDYVFVPIECGSEASLTGYYGVEKMIETINSQFDTNVECLGGFLTKVMPYKKDQKEFMEALEPHRNELNIFNSYIQYDYKSTIAYTRTFQPICIAAPKQKADVDYENLTNEVLKKIEEKDNEK